MSEELQAFFKGEATEPDWSERASVIDYMVEAERPLAGRSRAFDETAVRDLAARVFDRTSTIASSMSNHFILDAGKRWRGDSGCARSDARDSWNRGSPVSLWPRGRSGARDPRRPPASLGTDGPRVFPSAGLGCRRPRYLAAHIAQAAILNPAQERLSPAIVYGIRSVVSLSNWRWIAMRKQSANLDNHLNWSNRSEPRVH